MHPRQRALETFRNTTVRQRQEDHEAHEQVRLAFIDCATFLLQACPEADDVLASLKQAFDLANARIAGPDAAPFDPTAGAEKRP